MEGKIQLLLSLVLVFGITDAAEQEPEAEDHYTLPSFCQNSDCPKYTVVKQYENFEERAYEETRWVSTSMELDFFGWGTIKSFRRLFKYISGKNSEELKINMTVPVVIIVPMHQPPAVNSSMSFFVPHALASPPTPTDPDVFLSNADKSSVYVRSFGGYALDFTYGKHAKALAEDLRALGLAFEDSYYARAGYNDPFTFSDRHNEVWFRAKPTESNI